MDGPAEEFPDEQTVEGWGDVMFCSRATVVSMVEHRKPVLGSGESADAVGTWAEMVLSPTRHAPQQPAPRRNAKATGASLGVVDPRGLRGSC